MKANSMKIASSMKINAIASHETISRRPYVRPEVSLTEDAGLAPQGKARTTVFEGTAFSTTVAPS